MRRSRNRNRELAAKAQGHEAHAEEQRPHVQGVERALELGRHLHHGRKVRGGNGEQDEGQRRGQQEQGFLLVAQTADKAAQQDEPGQHLQIAAKAQARGHGLVEAEQEGKRLADESQPRQPAAQPPPEGIAQQHAGQTGHSGSAVTTQGQ